MQMFKLVQWYSLELRDFVGVAQLPGWTEALDRSTGQLLQQYAYVDLETCLFTDDDASPNSLTKQMIWHQVAAVCCCIVQAASAPAPTSCAPTPLSIQTFTC